MNQYKPSIYNQVFHISNKTNCLFNFKSGQSIFFEHERPSAALPNLENIEKLSKRFKSKLIENDFLVALGANELDELRETWFKARDCNEYRYLTFIPTSIRMQHELLLLLPKQKGVFKNV